MSTCVAFQTILAKQLAFVKEPTLSKYLSELIFPVTAASPNATPSRHLFLISQEDSQQLW